MTKIPPNLFGVKPTSLDGGIAEAVAVAGGGVHVGVAGWLDAAVAGDHLAAHRLLLTLVACHKDSDSDPIHK